MMRVSNRLGFGWCKRVTVLDTGNPTFEEVKKAVLEAEQYIQPSVDLEAGYDDEGCDLIVYGWVKLSDEEAQKFIDDENRQAQFAVESRRAHYEQLKREFEGKP